MFISTSSPVLVQIFCDTYGVLLQPMPLHGMQPTKTGSLATLKDLYEFVHTDFVSVSNFEQSGAVQICNSFSTCCIGKDIS